MQENCLLDEKKNESGEGIARNEVKGDSEVKINDDRKR